MFLKSSLFHNVVAMMLSLLVAACGGGGGESTNQNNPLEKYAGTYYACDKNEKTSLQLTASGQNNLAAQLFADVYSGPNCTGEIIGSYRQNGSSVVSYVSTGNSDLPALTIFPSSDTIDYVTLAIPAGTGTLTGNGVTGNCVNYSYIQGSSSISGSHCYDLVQQPATVTGGLYLSSDAQYLVQFQRVDGVYQAEKIISRNSSFDVESLIQDSSGGGSGGPPPPLLQHLTWQQLTLPPILRLHLPIFVSAALMALSPSLALAMKQSMIFQQDISRGRQHSGELQR